MKLDKILNTTIEAELYELPAPGKLIGLEVIDSYARKVGIVRSVKIQFFPQKISIIVKGLGVEFTISAEEIKAINSVVNLKIPAKQADEIQLQDVERLRDEIFSEIKSLI